MIYNNPEYGAKNIYTCPMCHRTFESGNMACAVMHYGVGCCHYGDKDITESKQVEAK